MANGISLQQRNGLRSIENIIGMKSVQCGLGSYLNKPIHKLLSLLTYPNEYTKWKVVKVVCTMLSTIVEDGVAHVRHSDGVEVKSVNTSKELKPNKL